MIKASVIGWPISHSRSPLIHSYWIQKHGISGSYTRQSVPPQELQQFILSLKHGNHVGTNVTLPHKETALSYIDDVDDRVRRIGALNTIWRENNKLYATSTDGPGFLLNLQHEQPALDVAAGPVTILGAGGTTRAIIDELLRAGVERILVHNRTYSRAETLVNHFGHKVHALQPEELSQALLTTGLLINTTSAEMTGQNSLHLPWHKLKTGAYVADVIYTPLITPFLHEARLRGHPIIPGLGMLLHQAVVGFEKWFGVTPQVTQELHDLVARDIDPEYTS